MENESFNDADSSIKQKVDECINNLKRSRNYPQFSELTEVCDISGYLKLVGGPHWSFVLEDSTYTLPCALINRVGFLRRIVNCNCSLVKISTGFMITESYRNNYHVVLLFSPSDMIMLKRQPIFSLAMPILAIETVLIIHVSTPVVIANGVFCFVLIKRTKKVNGSPYLWMALRDNEVMLHHFLVPNREYEINMSELSSYFEKTAQPLRKVLAKFKAIPVFKEILHHPGFWPTEMTVEFPSESSMIAIPTKRDSELKCRYKPAWWNSINDAVVNSSGSRIVSLWGEVLKIKYLEAEEKGGCSFCSKQYSAESGDFAKVPSTNENVSWRNPWEYFLEEDEFVELPDVSELPDVACSGTFMPDKLTKVVVLRDTETTRTVSLYIKNWSCHQYSNIFTPGVIVCCKFIHKRVSAKGLVYFVSCALSSFEVLEFASKRRKGIAPSIKQFGFPFLHTPPAVILWGVLDLWNLTNVIFSYNYRELCKSSDYHDQSTSTKNVGFFTATAKVTMDRYSGSAITVVLKDEQVQTFLGIPDEVWREFSLVCKEVTLSYDKSQSCNRPSKIKQMFHMFCAARNEKKQTFHIFCKKLPSREGFDDMYFCTEIRKPDPNHFLPEDISKSNSLLKIYENIR